MGLMFMPPMVPAATPTPEDTRMENVLRPLLKQWLVEDHGVTLVPLDEAIRLKAGKPTGPLAAR